MKNGDYASFTLPIQFGITQRLNQSGGEGDFDLTGDTYRDNVTAGRFTYSAGNGHGESFGEYIYQGDGFDVYSVDWTIFSAQLKIRIMAVNSAAEGEEE